MQIYTLNLTQFTGSCFNQGVVNEVSRQYRLKSPKRLRVGFRHTLESLNTCQLSHPEITLPIRQILNDSWPDRSPLGILGHNPQDAHDVYLTSLMEFRSQLPKSLKLLLAHKLGVTGVTHVLARGDILGHECSNGTILARLLAVSSASWSLTLIDPTAQAHQQYSLWLDTFFQAAMRLGLGIDRVFIIGLEKCFLIEP